MFQFPSFVWKPHILWEERHGNVSLSYMCTFLRIFVSAIADVAQKLWELEFTIHKVKISTSPDGKAVNLFFVTDNRY